MIAIVSAAFSNPAPANTGKVDFAIGNITVTGSDGRGRPLTKGAEVKSGDKIVCSVDGRAQIRFSDGAYVSLQPNTEFDIKEYRYSGKTDSTESALFGLFKGAMRTVTGLVSRANKNRYRIVTATATIAIRGTVGLHSIGGEGSPRVSGCSGILTRPDLGGRNRGVPVDRQRAYHPHCRYAHHPDLNFQPGASYGGGLADSGREHADGRDVHVQHDRCDPSDSCRRQRCAWCVEFRLAGWKFH